MSDLHLEFTENRHYIKTKPFQAEGDILVLAGDTFYLHDIIAPQMNFWDWASDNYDK